MKPQHVDKVLAMLQEVSDLYETVSKTTRSEFTHYRQVREDKERKVPCDITSHEYIQLVFKANKALTASVDATFKVHNLSFLLCALEDYKSSLAGQRDPIAELCKLSGDN